MARTPLFSWMAKMLRAAAIQPKTQSLPIDHPTAISHSNNLFDTPMTRRSFLKTSLGVASAITALSVSDALNPVFANSSNPVPPKPTWPHAAQKPVAIIGGGLGGLVTAYRLQKQGVRCELYEASHRLGGRVFTRSNFNEDGMFVELGGELVDTGHEDLIALCEELRVPLTHFAEQELGIEPAIYYSQGKVYTEDQVLAAFQDLAQVLANDLKRCFPDGNIQVPTYAQPAQAAWLDQLSLAEYLERQRNLTPEWVLRVIRSAYIGEYGLEPEEQSALNLVLLIGTDPAEGFHLFGESDESMRIKGGNSRLVDALVQAIRPQVPIHYGHRLSRLALRPGKTRQANANTTRELQLGISIGKQFRWVQAPQAVLALPFSLLRDVQGLDEIGLTDLKRRCIREWGYGTNSKQMIGFQSRFWRADHPNIQANSGEIITDLPSQCYWETSRMQAGKAGILTNFTGGKTGKNAKPTQWQTVLQELKPLYGDLDNQRDGHVAFFNWHRHPWNKGSYTCPKPGQYTTLMGVAQIPELDGRLFFAGEHCSVNAAGYMNGAVESGNTAAKQISEKIAQTAVLPKLVTLARI